MKEQLELAVADAQAEIEATLQRLIEVPIELYQELAGILVKQVVVRDSFKMALEILEEENEGRA